MPMNRALRVFFFEVSRQHDVRSEVAGQRFRKIVGDIKKVKKRLVEPKGELLSRRVPNPES